MGFTGHRIVALMAERHLTPQAKAAVADLLDGKSMADVSKWADELRNSPEYKHTAPWHFLHMPLGLSATQFEKAVTPLASPNIYSGLPSKQQILLTSSNKEQRAV
ncbi:hypothetical protein LLH06_10270 [Mucilaginibacter daejeonensis]|uniref:S1/P1 nuclease n=1 Tax=Mucilaginibacter daejeonensis TaxID=398049 RepID=UPI001D177455|nr:S1/P1 nuclease [Mucilaginibacter daejeonensis]UEG51357.1 hypothetical protein LLH06_10270 [Mucilaginibacter daejeonensis]